MSFKLIEKAKEGKMIRHSIILVVCILFVNSYAFAEKPTWAGKEKATVEQKQAHKKKQKD